MMISGIKKMSVPGRPKKAIDAEIIAAPKVKPILPPKEKTERLMPRLSSVETRLTMSAPCGWNIATPMPEIIVKKQSR